MTKPDETSHARRTGAASTGTWARWGFGFLMVLVLAGVMVYGIRQCTSTVGNLANLFQPGVNTDIVLRNTVTRVDQQAKLVVSSVDVTAEVQKSETYSWWKLYFGTTVARVRATGCKVQYVIPLDKFSPSNIEFLPGRKIVKIKVPEPVLDESLVDVNYGQLEVYASSAWSRFNKNEVAEEAKKLLRQAAITQGRQSFVQAAVKENAAKTIRQLAAPLTDSLRPDVRVDIEFVPQK